MLRSDKFFQSTTEGAGKLRVGEAGGAPTTKEDNPQKFRYRLEFPKLLLINLHVLVVLTVAII